MVKNNGAKFLLRGILAAAALSALAACDTISEATGETKIVPDEFATVTKAPLIVPPDFNLRPPRPGAPDLTPTPEDSARSALASNASASEQAVLTNAGANAADPNIRNTIATESGYQPADPNLTNKVLSTPAQNTQDNK